jgi:hypothetical protein
MKLSRYLIDVFDAESAATDDVPVGSCEPVRSTLSNAPLMSSTASRMSTRCGAAFSRHRHSNKTCWWCLNAPVHVHFYIRSRQQLSSHSLGRLDCTLANEAIRSFSPVLSFLKLLFVPVVKAASCDLSRRSATYPTNIATQTTTRQDGYPTRPRCHASNGT